MVSFVDEFFLLTPSGDPIVTRMLNGATRSHVDAFAEHVLKRGDVRGAAPLQRVAGVHFAHVLEHGLVYGLASAQPMGGAFAVDLLTRVARVFDDYCGAASEESLRLNVVLLHELLDDMVDTGVVQTASTARLRAQLFNEATVPHAVAPSASELLLNGLGLGGAADAGAAAAAAAARPLAVHHVNVAAVSAPPGDRLASALAAPGALAAASASLAGVGNDVNAMYVDVREQLTLVLDVDGRLRRSDVQGDISLLSTVRGTPLARLRLGDSVQLRSAVVGAGVSRDAWASQRLLQLHADSGRATVLRYRAALYRTATTSGGVPVQLAGRVSLDAPRSLLCMRLRLRACVPPPLHLADVVVRLRLPHTAVCSSARCVVRRNGAANDSSAAFEPAAADGERASLVWRTERVDGGAEVLLAVDLPVDDPAAALRDELSPLMCTFLASSWLASGVQLKLTVDDALSDTQTAASTRRWVATQTAVEFTRELEWVEVS